jgi:hypothetical protein
MGRRAARTGANGHVVMGPCPQHALGPCQVGWHRCRRDSRAGKPRTSELLGAARPPGAVRPVTVGTCVFLSCPPASAVRVGLDGARELVKQFFNIADEHGEL